MISLKIFFSLFLFFYSFSWCQDFRYQLSIAAVFQNEAPYLKEWIEFHRLCGVEHFVLFNNNSDDYYREVLLPYVEEGFVEVFELPSKVYEDDLSNFIYNVQLKAYNTAISLMRGVSKWLALIDVDEYIVVVKDFNILNCLENRFPLVSGLNINWQCYGTSGIEILDSSKPMIAQLLYKMPPHDPLNRNCKCIVKPLEVKECHSPHFCKYIKGCRGVDVKFRLCNGYSKTIEIDTIRINHYWTKDEWFLKNIKVPRYIKWGVNSIESLEKANKMNQEYDNIVENFLSTIHGFKTAS